MCEPGYCPESESRTTCGAHSLSPCSIHAKRWTVYCSVLVNASPPAHASPGTRPRGGLIRAPGPPRPRRSRSAAMWQATHCSSPALVNSGTSVLPLDASRLRGVWAAGVEPAAARRIGRRRHPTLQNDALALHVGVGHRDRRQCLGVGGCRGAAGCGNGPRRAPAPPAGPSTSPPPSR